MDPAWEHLSYDWGKTEPLDKLLEDLGSEGIVGASSEGGLFEYGSDLDIGANLTVLKRHAAVALMCGTVMKENEVSRLANASIRLSSISRSREAFMALAEGAGWHADAVLETPLTCVVRLRGV